MKLTESQRNSLPDSAFGVLNPKGRTERERRKYPIFDRSHARNALARVAQKGTPTEMRLVCIRVRKKFPDIHESSCPVHLRSDVERF